MVDLLAHAFVALAAGRVLATRREWFGRPYVTATMAGAFVPDLVKVSLLVPGWQVEAVTGLPFDWMPFETVAGTTLCVLVGGLVVVPAVRTRVLAALSVGAGSHLVLDALLATPSGRLYHPPFWPLTQFHTPSPGLFHSAQVWPTVVAALLAAVVVVGTDPASSERPA